VTHCNNRHAILSLNWLKSCSHIQGASITGFTYGRMSSGYGKPRCRTLQNLSSEIRPAFRASTHKIAAAVTIVCIGAKIIGIRALGLCHFEILY
jgi:hypothetical protein